ncbi:putative Late embryogenesis abundant protein, LEA5-type [Rosa chinensis]|uniref:Putative Late embryogenesis abundant protein, LEA5-type n=1 Tax=Rosa chinensis TaxID=74649 RepID=A0A2P6RZ81_ROSCH|nr:putative Late embryogenesis abundant protein, LEA5-type [Rosa chinensis]
MAKVPMNPFLLLSKRWYKVAAESTSTERVQPAVSTMRKMATTESSGSSGRAVADDQEKKKVFWMRDPKTGNWIPENHFEEIDAAELREKLLNKHKV